MDDDASASSTKEDYKDLCTQLTGKVIKQHAKIVKLKRENKRLKKELQLINQVNKSSSSSLDSLLYGHEKRIEGDGNCLYRSAAESEANTQQCSN